MELVLLRNAQSCGFTRYPADAYGGADVFSDELLLHISNTYHSDGLRDWRSFTNLLKVHGITKVRVLSPTDPIDGGSIYDLE